MSVLIYVLQETANFGEVVELVYGTSLENWRRFIAYRGFESHPLRQLFFCDFLYKKYSNFNNLEAYPSG